MLIFFLFATGLAWGLWKATKAYRSPSYELRSSRIYLTAGVILLALALVSIIVVMLDIPLSPAARRFISLTVLAVPLLGLAWLITTDIEKRRAAKDQEALLGQPQPRFPSKIMLLLGIIAWVLWWIVGATAVITLTLPQLSSSSTVMTTVLVPIVLGIIALCLRYSVLTYRADRALKAQRGQQQSLDAAKDPWAVLADAWNAPLPPDQSPGATLARLLACLLGTAAAIGVLALALAASMPTFTDDIKQSVAFIFAGILLIVGVYILAHLSHYFRGAKEALRAIWRKDK